MSAVARAYDSDQHIRVIVRQLSRSAPSRRRRVLGRLAVLARALDATASKGASVPAMLNILERELDAGSRHDMWFAISVLTASLPLEDEVVDAARRGRVEGLFVALGRYLSPGHGVKRFMPALVHRTVEVTEDGVLVDVDHTSKVVFATGIQRVVRETVKRWGRDNDIILVGWTGDRTALRRLSPPEQIQALTGKTPPQPISRLEVFRLRITSRFRQTIVVPRSGHYVLPELSLERHSLFRVAALAQFSGNSTSAIGFDAVPISSSETVNFLVSGGFASYLAALKHFDRLSTISFAAASEYEGWRKMLSGTGIDGPTIGAIALPSAISQPANSEDVIARVANEFNVSGLPLVLCVGSHEPRKNHLAVLHAAEKLWREGHQFALLFVGGNSWNSADFTLNLKELAQLGRPIRAEKSVSDDELWALYTLARFTVFPSLNEGFGLPVAESLSTGTPVLTSNFGATEEIVARGGAITVDPRDQTQITDGMRKLLDDEELIARLASEARGVESTTWDDYASGTWSYLVKDR